MKVLFVVDMITKYCQTDNVENNTIRYTEDPQTDT